MLVRIKQLEASTIIGVNDWEKEKPQNVLLTLEMELEHEKSLSSDALDDTVDYYHVSHMLRDYLAQEKTELIERLAAKIADKLFMECKLIKTIALEIDKPGAVEYAASVSVFHCFSRGNDA